MLEEAITDSSGLTAAPWLQVFLLSSLSGIPWNVEPGESGWFCLTAASTQKSFPHPSPRLLRVKSLALQLAASEPARIKNLDKM